MVVAVYATAAAQQLVRIRPNQSAAYGSRARPAKPESRSPENYTPVYRFVPGAHPMSPSCYAPLSPRTSLIPPNQGYAQQPRLLSHHRAPHPRPAQARRSPAGSRREAPRWKAAGGATAAAPWRLCSRRPSSPPRFVEGEPQGVRRRAVLPLLGTGSAVGSSARGSSIRNPSRGDPSAARARNRVSASKSVRAMVDSSSISLLMLILRRIASWRSFSCFSSGKRIVRVAMAQVPLSLNRTADTNQAALGAGGRQRFQASRRHYRVSSRSSISGINWRLGLLKSINILPLS